jgi:hypothetical protein
MRLDFGFFIINQKTKACTRKGQIRHKLVEITNFLIKILIKMVSWWLAVISILQRDVHFVKEVFCQRRTPIEKISSHGY